MRGCAHLIGRLTFQQEFCIFTLKNNCVHTPCKCYQDSIMGRPCALEMHAEICKASLVMCLTGVHVLVQCDVVLFMA